MPISARVDHAHHLVIATGTGLVQDADVFGYQTSVWSQENVGGYDEIFDMRRVEQISVPSAERVRELAKLSATMDRPRPEAASPRESRFAIVAPDEIANALARMYEVFREMEPGSTKKVSVFRTMEPALQYLGIEGPLEG